MLYIGAIGASLLGYILPCLIYFHTYKEEFVLVYTHNIIPILKHVHWLPAVTVEEPETSAQSEGTTATSAVSISLWTLLYNCLISLKSFYFAIFSGVFGIFLLILGVTTVIYDYYHT